MPAGHMTRYKYEHAEQQIDITSTNSCIVSMRTRFQRMVGLAITVDSRSLQHRCRIIGTSFHLPQCTSRIVSIVVFLTLTMCSQSACVCVCVLCLRRTFSVQSKNNEYTELSTHSQVLFALDIHNRKWKMNSDGKMLKTQKCSFAEKSMSSRGEIPTPNM